MAAMAANLDLVSVDYMTNTWVNCSDFFVAYWGSLEKGSSLVPFDDQRRRSFKVAARQPYWISFLSII
jgi:hypothetical protein